MAMMDQRPDSSYFQTTHSRVDSKLHSDTSDKLDDATFALFQQRPISNGLRRCAATRDLTRSSVNYCAKVSVEYMVGDASTPFHALSWKPLSAPEGSSDEVIVDNFETVRRFKKTLYRQLCPYAEESLEDNWPDLTLYRRRDTAGFEAIEGDQEALYMFALKDGDRVVLLVHEASRMDSRRPHTSRNRDMLTLKKQLTVIAIAICALSLSAQAAEELDCTVKHPTTGKFYDLRPLIRKDSDEDYTPKTGVDAQMDFKLNVCHAVLTKDLDVKNPDDIASWGKKIKGSSLGKLSKNPFFRGDSLLLEYKDGDDCPDAPYYKKSTLIRFVCDSSVSGQGTPYLISNNNNCNFWFEWHTPAACSVERPSGGSSGGVFGTIIGVAIFVYFVGGIAYNRIVHHARGLKQIPNYHSWVDAFDFVKDMAIILFAKCYRPKRAQTYHNLPVDSEINTLIDDDYEDDEV
ncbi:Cation-independent mannose-6-phosphate receptor CI-MPR [Mortierella sp. GBA30]|nr:Cation-independent mannose-6-phosphate receptor CI-MPR [Mortierella sp. GBA30]